MWVIIFHVIQIIFSSRYCTVWGRSPRVKFGCQSQSQRWARVWVSPSQAHTPQSRVFLFQWALSTLLPGKALVTSHADGIKFCDLSKEYHYPCLKGGWLRAKGNDLRAWDTEKCGLILPNPRPCLKPNITSFQSQVTPSSLSRGCSGWQKIHLTAMTLLPCTTQPSGKTCDLPSPVGDICHLPAHVVRRAPAELPPPLSPRMSQPDHSPPPSGRGTCPQRRGCCACWAAPCVSPLWLPQGSSPVKRDLSLGTSGDHAPSGSCVPPLLAFYQMSVIWRKVAWTAGKSISYSPCDFFFLVP